MMKLAFAALAAVLSGVLLAEPVRIWEVAVRPIFEKL